MNSRDHARVGLWFGANLQYTLNEGGPNGDCMILSESKDQH